MISDFHHPLRQSPWAILFILWHYGRILVRQLWPLLVIFFVRPADQRGEFGLWLFVGILLVMLVSSLVSHFFFYYWIDGDTFYVRQGWLSKKHKTIPIDRIQSLNVEQTMLHRLTQTGKVLIETAGSSKAEVEMNAVSMTDVEALRAQLFSRVISRIEPAGEQATPVEEKPLFILGMIDLLKIGLSQNHLRTIGVVLVVVIGFLDDLQNQWGLLPEDKLEEVGKAVQSMMWLGILGVMLTVGVIIASVIRILVTHADLALYFNGRRFRINAGLLTIRETIVSNQKLQSLTWSENPLQRLFGLYQLVFAQASAEVTRGRQQVGIPGLYADQLRQILGLVFREESRCDGAWWGVDIRYAWRQWITVGFLPGLVLIIIGLITSYSVWPVGAIWLVLSIGVALKQRQHWRCYLNRDILILRHGWLAPMTTLLPVYKVQSVSLHQNPIQRMHDLITVTIHTASGVEVIPYLSRLKAEGLQRYILYRIESDQRAWM